MLIAGNSEIISSPSIAIAGNAYLGTIIHANTATRTYTFPDTTGTVLLNNNVLGYALPSLTTGFLNWTGSAWAFSGAGGSVSTTDDNTTNASYYPVMTTTAGGSTLKTSSTELKFNPSTNNLTIQNLTIGSSTSNLFVTAAGGLTLQPTTGSSNDFLIVSSPAVGMVVAQVPTGTNTFQILGLLNATYGFISTRSSALPFLSAVRSDLSATDTLTQTASHLFTSTAQIVLPNDPTTSLQTSTKQYVDNNLATIQPSSVAAAIGPWTAYTPVWTSSGTAPSIGNGTLAGMYRRVGDSMEVTINLTMGTTTTFGTGNWQFSVPSGYTISQSVATTGDCGTCWAQISGLGSYHMDAYVYTSTNIGALVGAGWAGPSIPNTWSALSSNTLQIKATVPITQFSANINLLTSFTEYAYNSSTTTSTDTTSFGYGSTGVLVQSFAPSGTTAVQKTVQFTQPIQPTDLIIVEVWNATAGWIPSTSMTWGFASNGSGTYYGIQLEILNSTQARVDFYSGPFNGSSWSTYSAYKWRVRKTSNGNFAQGSPSVPFTIGDGVTTSFTLTHNLGVSDVDVACWELTGLGRKVDSGIQITNPTQSKTQVVLTFASAPATNSIRAIVFSSGGTQASGDMLSTVANAELQITTTATATLRTWHNCTATSASYAITLPPAASCSGQFIGIRIDSSSTYLVTVTGNASELIDGSNTRIMHNGESCELKSNGVSWNKVGGITIPMVAKLYKSTTFITTSGVFGKDTFDTAEIQSVGMADTANSQIVIKRPGNYMLATTQQYENTNTSPSSTRHGFYLNGATYLTDLYQQFQGSTNNYVTNTYFRNFSLNDTLQVWTGFTGGSYTSNIAIYAGAAYNYFHVIEIPTW